MKIGWWPARSIAAGVVNFLVLPKWSAYRSLDVDSMGFLETQRTAPGNFQVSISISTQSSTAAFAWEFFSWLGFRQDTPVPF
jgi:hypothetical protein